MKEEIKAILNLLVASSLGLLLVFLINFDHDLIRDQGWKQAVYWLEMSVFLMVVLFSGWGILARLFQMAVCSTLEAGRAIAQKQGEREETLVSLFRRVLTRREVVKACTSHLLTDEQFRLDVVQAAGQTPPDNGKIVAALLKDNSSIQDLKDRVATLIATDPDLLQLLILQLKDHISPEAHVLPNHLDVSHIDRGEDRGSLGRGKED